MYWLVIQVFITIEENYDKFVNPRKDTGNNTW